MSPKRAGASQLMQISFEASDSIDNNIVTLSMHADERGNNQVRATNACRPPQHETIYNQCTLLPAFNSATSAPTPILWLLFSLVRTANRPFHQGLQAVLPQRWRATSERIPRGDRALVAPQLIFVGNRP